MKKSIPLEELRGFLASKITFTTNKGEIKYEGKNGTSLTEVYQKTVPTKRQIMQV